MNRHDLESAAKALESSGYRFYAPSTTDGANIRRYDPVDWRAVIGAVMQARGWVIGPEVEERTGPELKLVPSETEEG